MNKKDRHIDNYLTLKIAQKILHDQGYLYPSKGYPIRDLVRMNFKHNLHELREILKEVGSKIVDDFIKDLESSLDIYEFMFAQERHAGSKITGREKYSTKQLESHIKGAIGQAERLMYFLEEFETHLFLVCGDTFGAFADRSNEKSYSSFYDEIKSWSQHRMILKAHLGEEIEYLKYALKDLSLFPKALTTRQAHKNIFLKIGERLQVINVTPTTTYNPDISSYGTFIKLITWFYEIYEVKLPSGLESQLREAVDILKIEDKEERDNKVFTNILKGFVY